MSEDKWIMHGKSLDDPDRIKSVKELTEYVNTLGFLPLFRNEIAGFSLEENAATESWWTGDPENDPWEWREIIAREGNIAYGKFFGKKAGFISKEYFPFFANYRRDGYDFDSLYEDGKARERSNKIMRLFESNERLFTTEIKSMAGFGKGGERNFGGIITELQMQTYLVCADFKCRTSKKGSEYGMRIAIMTTPESLWGYDLVSSAYSEAPTQSFERLVSRMKTVCPDTDELILKKFLK